MYRTATPGFAHDESNSHLGSSMVLTIENALMMQQPQSIDSNSRLQNQNLSQPQQTVAMTLSRHV